MPTWFVSCSIGGDDSVGAEKGEALLADLWERLVEDEDIDAALALAEHPLEEIVIHLCRDMGIHPDPAWLNSDYSGTDWSYGREAEATSPDPNRRCGPRAARRRAGTSTSRAAGKPLPAGSTSSPRSGSTARPGS